MEKAKTGEHHNSFIPVQVVKHMSDLYSYDTQTTLGSGQYGSVYKVYRLKYITHKALYKKSGSHCVIKIVKRDRGYLRELDHLITLRGCYSVLPIIEQSSVPKNLLWSLHKVYTTKKMQKLIYDTAECSLHKYIRTEHVKPYKKTIIQVLKEAVDIAHQLLMSLYQVHTNHIIHRDFKEWKCCSIS